MLDKKDEIIMEALMHNARIEVKELAKLTNLTKPTIVYRIEQLEKQGFISKYDAIINYSKFELYKEFIFLNVSNRLKPDFLKLLDERKEICSCFETLSNQNFVLLGFYKTKKQKEDFHKLLKKFSPLVNFYEISNIRFKPYSVFNLNLKFKEEKVDDKIIKLDKTDIKLIKTLSDGNARKSILELSELVGEKYDKLLYRFKKLKKSNYFPIFFAQPSTTKFHIQNDFLIINTNNNNLKIYDNLKEISQIPYFCELNDKKLLLQILTKNFEEFKSTLAKIKEKIDEFSTIEVYNTHKTHLLNRYPLEWLV
ncbi:MAG: winged helix-turn-helix transcriptional regulator [Nanoarchaeota archaeon]